MGSFERFKTKTHFNSLKRLVGVTALAALAVKLLTIALATAAGGGTPLDLLARVPASVADLGAALLVFEVLRPRRPLQLAARSAILVAVSPVLFVASGLHGDRVGVAVALLLLAVHLLVDRDAPLVAGITLAIASRVEPMALLAAPVAMAAIAAGGDGREPATAGPSARGWSTSAGPWPGPCSPPGCRPWPGTGTRWRPPRVVGRGPGGLGPGWVLARSLDQGLAGWLLGPGRPLVLAAAVVPAVIWVRRRPRRVYAAVGLVLLAPLALGPAWSPRDLVWPAVFGYLGDARWASMYAVVAGATLLWTSTWWGSGVPWHGGVDPATVPSGAVAGLGMVIWVVLGSWVVLGWRTIAVEAPARGSAGAAAGTGPGHAGAPANGSTPVYGSSLVDGSTAANGSAPVDDSAPANSATPANSPAPANGSPPADGAAPVGQGTSSSRGSVSLPK